MATIVSDDLENLKRQLQETTAACQRCMVAIDYGVPQKRSPSNDRQTQLYDALHIQQLLLKISDLEEQLMIERQKKTQTLSESHQKRIDNLIVKYKEKIQDTEDEKIQVVAENQRLRMEVSELQRKFQVSEEVILALMTPREPVASDQQERISMLETQLQIYKEDFESERRDRKTQHDRAIEMEQRVNHLTRQLEQRSTSFSHQQLQPPTASDYHRGHCAGGHASVSVHARPNTMRADAAEDRCSSDERNRETGPPSNADATDAMDAEGCDH